MSLIWRNLKILAPCIIHSMYQSKIAPLIYFSPVKGTPLLPGSSINSRRPHYVTMTQVNSEQKPGQIRVHLKF